MNKKSQLKQKRIKEVIALFESGERLTVTDIKKMYNSNREYARQMIDTISLKIPLWKCELRKAPRGWPIPVYKVLTDADLEEFDESNIGI